jgi:hypothetical protein
VLQPIPKRRHTQLNGQLALQTSLEFDQGKIVLLCDPSAQGLFVPRQPGAPVAATLFGRSRPELLLPVPITLHTALGNLELPRQFLCALSSSPASNQPLS